MEFHELQSIVEFNSRTIQSILDDTVDFRNSVDEFRRSVETAIEEARSERPELRQAMARMAEDQAGIANRQSCGKQ